MIYTCAKCGTGYYSKTTAALCHPNIEETVSIETRVLNEYVDAIKAGLPETRYHLRCPLDGNDDEAALEITNEIGDTTITVMLHIDVDLLMAHHDAATLQHAARCGVTELRYRMEKCLKEYA